MLSMDLVLTINKAYVLITGEEYHKCLIQDHKECVKVVVLVVQYVTKP